MYKQLIKRLNQKKDFYLSYLLKGYPKSFSPQELIFARNYYLTKGIMPKPETLLCDNICQGKIPLCDEQAVKEIKARINYLIQKLASMDESTPPIKKLECQQELDNLKYYLKNSLDNKGKIYYFTDSYTLLKRSVLKAIHRSFKAWEHEFPLEISQLRHQLGALSASKY